MRNPLGSTPARETPLIESIGWWSALVLLPAVGMIAYRRWRPSDERLRAPPRRWPDWLFLAGAAGQVAYGVATRNRAFTASGSFLALGEGLGLVAARGIPRSSNTNHHHTHAALITTNANSGDFRSWDATLGGISMNSHDHENGDEHDDRQTSESSPPRNTDATESRSAIEPQTIDTDDPVVVAGPPQGSQWKQHPDSTMVIQTSRIREPEDSRVPSLVMVPVEYDPKSGRGSQAKDDQDDDDDDRDDKKQRSAKSEKKRDQDDDDRDDKKHRSAKSQKKRDDRDRDDDDDDQDQLANPPSMMKILLFAGLVALVCGMAGAFGYSYFFGSKKSDDQQSSGQNQSNSQNKSSDSSKNQKSGSNSGGKSGSNSGSTAENGKEIPGFTDANDSDTLRKQNEHLAERIDRMSERIDALSQPRNETSPDVRTLQIKVGNLAHTVEDMGDLTSRFRRMENRIEDVSQQVKMLRSQMTDPGLNGLSPVPGLNGLTPAPRPAVVVPTGPTSMSLPNLAPQPLSAAEAAFALVNEPDPALTQGIRLFREGRYRDAENIFRKLQLTRSWDARVWYFSALSRGLLTGDWKEETRQLVSHGLEREKLGQPPTKTIDAALSGLTKSQGKDWLASFRAPAIVKR